MLHKNLVERPRIAVSGRLFSGVMLASLLVSATSVAAPVQTTRVNDADLDTVPDTVDVDDDNDGILDRFEIAASGSDVDSDGDGMPDRLDLDSDNDGISDLQESGAFLLPAIATARVVNGRLRTSVGLNGYADVLETSVDNSVPAFRLLKSDEADGDVMPDFLDLDSDNDGLTDLIEAGVPTELDGNKDGRIDAASWEVGADGILDRLQLNNDANCCDFDGDGVEDTVPRNTDSSDLPDYLDVDSDNDGVFDLVESGGNDLDADGRIDGFFDNPESPDGVDDAILLVPYTPLDNNSDGIPDYLQINVASSQSPVSVAEPPVDTDPVISEPVTEPAAEPTPPATVIPDPATDPAPALPASDADPAESQTDDVSSEEPDSSAAMPLNDESVAPITTGLVGGCVVSSGRASFDPLLLLLLVVSLLGLARQKRKIKP